MSREADLKHAQKRQDLTLEQWEEYAIDVAAYYYAEQLTYRSLRREVWFGEKRDLILEQSAKDLRFARDYFGAVFKRYQGAGGDVDRSTVKVLGQVRLKQMYAKIAPHISSSSKP